MSKSITKSPTKKSPAGSTSIKQAVAKKAPAKKLPAKKSAAKKSVSNAPVHVCIDRQTTMLNAPKRMLHSIRHNKDNSPAEPGTEAQKLVEHFVANPHHSFSPQEAATLAEMAIVTSAKWQKNATITISFMDGSAKQKEMVQLMAKKWLPHISMKFKYVDKNGMIRISFKQEGSWSYIGTQCLSVDATKPTMNFGWLKANSSVTEWERVVVHEFGHALGCIHEHQNPAGGINWNKPAVYKYYQGPPNNWSKADVDNNLFNKYAENRTQFTQVDRSSIMMYPIPKAFLLSGDEVGWNTQLSETDKAFAKKTYK